MGKGLFDLDLGSFAGQLAQLVTLQQTTIDRLDRIGEVLAPRPDKPRAVPFVLLISPAARPVSMDVSSQITRLIVSTDTTGAFGLQVGGFIWPFHLTSGAPQSLDLRPGVPAGRGQLVKIDQTAAPAATVFAWAICAPVLEAP